MSKSVYIFLSNKLISCDTIVPLIKEVADSCPRTNFVFVNFDVDTTVSIKGNTILWDAIQSIGTFEMRGRRSKGAAASILHKIGIVPWLIKLMLQALLGRAVFLHFKELNAWPLRLLGVLARSRTIYCESTAIGYAPLEKLVSEQMRVRNYDTACPTGDTLIAFSEHWEALKDPRLQGRNVFQVPPPFSRRHWIDWLATSGASYFEREFNEAGITPSEEIIPYMLCWMGPNNQTRRPEMYPELFDETLGILSETCGHLPIFVKPHPVDVGNEKALQDLQAIIARHKNLQVVMTALHPVLLAQRARLIIANTYTTSFSAPKFLGLDTVEYTDYRDEILETTGHQSMRPDMVSHFINHDPDALRTLLKKLMSAGAYSRNVGDDMPLPRELIEFLSPGRAHTKFQQPEPAAN